MLGGLEHLPGHVVQVDFVVRGAGDVACQKAGKGRLLGRAAWLLHQGNQLTVLFLKFSLHLGLAGEDVFRDARMLPFGVQLRPFAAHAFGSRFKGDGVVWVCTRQGCSFAADARRTTGGGAFCTADTAFERLQGVLVSVGCRGRCRLLQGFGLCLLRALGLLGICKRHFAAG